MGISNAQRKAMFAKQRFRMNKEGKPHCPHCGCPQHIKGQCFNALCKFNDLDTSFDGRKVKTARQKMMGKSA